VTGARAGTQDCGPRSGNQQTEVVNGARQVGKTTLVGSLAVEGASELVTLHDPAIREAARLDRRAFVDRSVGTARDR
jgi:hypothetical protein